MYRMRRAVVLMIALLMVACGTAAGPDPTVIDLPEVDAAGFPAFLATDPRPTVVNVWGSWCGPCRAEAPLLADAWAAHGDEVRFVGVNVQDTQDGAKGFIDRYRLGFEHVFDPAGTIPADLRGYGVPVTFFVDADGAVVSAHSGIINEAQLLTGIDTLLLGH